MDIDPRLAQLHALLDYDSPYSDRWTVVETGLNITFPPRYKLIVDTFDDLSFGDFIHVLSPFSDSYDFRDTITATLDADSTSREQFPAHYPFPLYPEPAGLFPWAVTDNGDNLYWVTTSEDCEQWPTLLRGARA